MKENKENIEKEEDTKEQVDIEFDFLTIFLVCLSWPIILTGDLVSWGIKKLKNKK